ncbi:hypothetical protein H5U35_03535 [Candidatus Aerophobetes bacterium]|nr:hypothetical protein [Candidatus Aerophobetes bacterium]
MTSITGDFKGLSLVELIVVVGVIFFVLSGTSLYFRGHLSKTRLKTSSQEIADTLRLTRRLAITGRKPYRTCFDVKKGKYWIENEEGERIQAPFYLKDNIVFANPQLDREGEEDGLVEGGIPDDSFSFYPQGTAEGGSIYIKDKAEEKWNTITITPSTGDVRIYENKHKPEEIE